MAAKGYNPDAPSAAIAPDVLAAFISNTVSEDVKTVPGIGEASEKALLAAGVTTTHQLIGQFLVLRSAGMGVKEHMDAFYTWLGDVGCASNGKQRTVRAIAEKVNVLIPGIYDASVY